MISAEVESAEPLTEFTYFVIARGNIVHGETVEMPNRDHIIQFRATFEMAPSARLLVFYFKGDDIRSAVAEFSLREDLNNYLKIKLSPLQAKPGSTVNIDISTRPKSYVGLLGVDQRVLLLKNNEELNKDDAFSDMEHYQYQLHEKSEDYSAQMTHDSYYITNAFRVSPLNHNTNRCMNKLRSDA